MVSVAKKNQTSCSVDVYKLAMFVTNRIVKFRSFHFTSVHKSWI